MMLVVRGRVGSGDLVHVHAVQCFFLQASLLLTHGGIRRAQRRARVFSPAMN